METQDDGGDKAQQAVQSLEVGDALAGDAMDANGPPVRVNTASLRTRLQPARDELASHGCARAVGHPIPGVNALSAPVFGHDGEPALLISLLGHHDHVPAAWSSATAVKRAAAETSAQQGHRPAT